MGGVVVLWFGWMLDVFDSLQWNTRAQTTGSACFFFFFFRTFYLIHGDSFCWGDIGRNICNLMGGMSPSLMPQTFRDDVFSYYSTYILYTISNTRWVFGSEQLRPTVENHHETPCRTGWPGKVKIGTDVAASEFYKSDEKARFEISVLSFSGGRRCCGWIEDGMAGSFFLDIWYIHVLLSTLTTNQAHYGGSGERKMVLLRTLSPSPFWMESICMNKNYFTIVLREVVEVFFQVKRYRDY